MLVRCPDCKYTVYPSEHLEGTCKWGEWKAFWLWWAFCATKVPGEAGLVWSGEISCKKQRLKVSKITQECQYIIMKQLKQSFEMQAGCYDHQIYESLSLRNLQSSNSSEYLFLVIWLFLVLQSMLHFAEVKILASASLENVENILQRIILLHKPC